MKHIHYKMSQLNNPGLDGLHFIEGLFKGLLQKDITAIEQCAVGASGVFELANKAIHAFA